jgi:hypothetical protein
MFPSGIKSIMTASEQYPWMFGIKCELVVRSMTSVDFFPVTHGFVDEFENVVGVG